MIPTLQPGRFRCRLCPFGDQASGTGRCSSRHCFQEPAPTPLQVRLPEPAAGLHEPGAPRGCAGAARAGRRGGPGRPDPCQPEGSTRRAGGAERNRRSLPAEHTAPPPLLRSPAREPTRPAPVTPKDPGGPFEAGPSAIGGAAVGGEGPAPLPPHRGEGGTGEEGRPGSTAPRTPSGRRASPAHTFDGRGFRLLERGVKVIGLAA